ncbi:dehydration-responsive element-binding protein 3 [Glycine max]|uniref:dehydration-responsive element-binding protein 3 n=1 Tax=Glycine max TaxID=3847 RepID=UPI0003DEAE0C|nr:dehydration-responsive element-binding protein 3 [Glycine max]|eukprot:XP_003534428.2 dehydration-responsive element-binding protein 3 [Glycine max]
MDFGNAEKTYDVDCVVEKAKSSGSHRDTVISEKAKRKRQSAFRGVRKRSWGRYVSEIRLPGQKTRIWLGSFGSPEMAARAYDSAAFFLKGTSATLNFPDLVHSLPRPLSSSRRDIQSAAAEAALHSPPPKEEQESIFTSTTTSSFHDVMEAPLMSPLRVDSTFGDFSWDQLFDFNDDILIVGSTSATLVP